MSYLDLVRHYENCYNKYGDNNKGVDWPNVEDANKRYKVMLEIIKFDNSNFDNGDNLLLDFGCGLAHMYEYIVKNKLKCRYEGMDISNVFIKKCKEKFPNVVFYKCDILNDNIEKTWDYIIMNGVFTEKREMSYDEMLMYFKQLVKKIYKICNKGIAFNVMSKDVDWEREDLFHLPLNELSSFLTKEVTRNFIIRYDYGLYEYTVYIYKR